MAGKKQGTSARVLVTRAGSSGQWVVSSRGSRRLRTFATKSEATEAARALAGGDDIAVLESQSGAASPLEAFVDSGGPEGGRTTLRVPDELTAAAALLASELGISKNDALVRLALAGARVAEQARAVSETRERRWLALLAAQTHDDAAGFPELSEMEEAALALRRETGS